MTKLTRETPFKEMLSQYIDPTRFTTIIVTVNSTIKAEKSENPVKMNVAKNIENKDNDTEVTVMSFISRYCS